MRILIISTFFPPQNSIASLRPYSWAKYWAQAGHDVTVLTTPKIPQHSTDLLQAHTGYKLLEVPLPKIFNLLKRQYSSMPSHALPLKQSYATYLKKLLINFFEKWRQRTGVLNSCRMPDFSDLWIRPALKTIQNAPKWDLVISTSGPYAVHMIASTLKKRERAQAWIADYRDRWSDSCSYPGLFPFNLMERFFEKRLLQHVDLITTVSQPFAEHYARHYRHPIKVLENGFDRSDIEKLDPASIFPNDGKFRIVYTGNIYQNKQKADALLQAIQLLSKDSTKSYLLDSLEVIFSGFHLADLPQLIALYEVSTWVKIYAPVPREQALRLQRDAQALLFLPWNDLKNDGVLTGKIFEYLSSKTPIWAVGGAGIEASQQLIIDMRAGIIFDDVYNIRDRLVEQLISGEFPTKNVLTGELKQFERQVLAEKLLAYAQSIPSLRPQKLLAEVI